jgi:glycosyltransferase involved in cell wall biosynthesis
MAAGFVAPARSRQPRVVVVRGHQANPWELRPWERPAISGGFDVVFLSSRRGWFDTSSIALARRRAWTLRDLLPPGKVGDMAVRIPGDRYLRPSEALRGADIVHAQELGYWYSTQAANLKRRLGFRLVLTVWETIPLLGAYRNFRTRPYRRVTLAETDLFLATTDRARAALLLEGAPAERIRVSAPGVLAEFEPESASDVLPGLPLIFAVGRLVWEKGHQDVMRALAMLRSAAWTGPGVEARLRIYGTGPEESRLRAYARELGIADVVEFCGFVAHDDMLRAYQQASCLVLASLPTWSWEEQFGMVLSEAAAAGVPIVASSSGAIRDVAPDAARFFAPGDWPALARTLAEVLSSERPPPTTLPKEYSVDAAAERLAAAYTDLLTGKIGETVRRPADRS